MIRLYSNSRRKRRGQALVEAAIIFPLLLTLTFGLIEYGWLFLKQQQVTNAARQAARLGARVDATNSQVNGIITTLFTSYQLTSSGYTTTLSPSDVSTVTKGNSVSVSISVPYSNIKLTGVSLFPTPTTISASVVMEKEGP